LNFGDDIRTQRHDILDMLFPSFQTEEREGDGPSVEAQLRATNSAKLHGGERVGRMGTDQRHEHEEIIPANDGFPSTEDESQNDGDARHDSAHPHQSHEGRPSVGHGT
jgi:hypothetical protein